MKILVVAAHPDDEVLGMGGTIKKLSKEGNEIKTIFLSTGILARRPFENKASDHALCISKRGGVKITLEISYVMWKNTFSCDLLASKGSAHIDNLCKWGKSTFTFRKRKFPSDKPNEKKKNFI